MVQAVGTQRGTSRPQDAIDETNFVAVALAWVVSRSFHIAMDPVTAYSSQDGVHAIVFTDKDAGQRLSSHDRSCRSLNKVSTDYRVPHRSSRVDANAVVLTVGEAITTANLVTTTGDYDHDGNSRVGPGVAAYLWVCLFLHRDVHCPSSRRCGWKHHHFRLGGRISTEAGECGGNGGTTRLIRQRQLPRLWRLADKPAIREAFLLATRFRLAFHGGGAQRFTDALAARRATLVGKATYTGVCGWSAYEAEV